MIWYEKDQEIKQDAGKPRVSLVPLEMLIPIARIREYGLNKYGDKESWKSVEPERYRDALLRHMIQYIKDPHSIDEESGLPTLWHIACNVAFLTALDEEYWKEKGI